MNCSSEPFTHIFEWKICSHSSRSLGSLFWILVVATVTLGSASMIFFPFPFPLLGSDSRLEHASDSEAVNLVTNDYLVRHSLVLWVGLLWNSHHFPVSFLDFVVLFFSCSFDGLSWVTPPWFCPLVFRFTDPKSCFFCLNFCSILTSYRYVVPSEMFRNSISSWMYLCRQPRYLSTKCSLESLIPNYVWKVWKIFVNSGTSSSLPCCSVVHFMYLSS